MRVNQKEVVKTQMHSMCFFELKFLIHFVGVVKQLCSGQEPPLLALVYV